MTKLIKIAAAVSAVLAVSAAAHAQDFAKPGAQLAIGEKAVVPHLIPNGADVPIEFAVTSVEEGSVSDLQGFQIPPQLKDARPVYVRYTYKNLGTQDISHQQVGAIVAIDDRNQEHAASMTLSNPSGGASFNKCLPGSAQGITQGVSHDGCVMFMIHNTGNIQAVAYKGGYRHSPGSDTRADYPIYYNPVRWTGAASSGSPTAGRVVGPGG